MMEYKPTFLPATARTRLQTAAHRCYRYNGTCGGTTRRLGTVEHAQSQVPWPDALARIIHERFCCNRRSAATTGLRPAGSPLGSSTYCTSTHWVLTAPHAGLATRLSDVATNRHESCGLMGSDFSGRYLQLKKNFFARTVVPNSIFHKEKVTAALVWAMKDPAFGKPRYLDRWRTIFPQAQVETLDNASHYLQEDRPDRIVEAITAQ